MSDKNLNLTTNGDANPLSTEEKAPDQSNTKQTDDQDLFSSFGRSQTTEKGIKSRKGLKIGMGVSWPTVIAGIAAAATTLALMLASSIAIPLYAVIIPAGVALLALIPAITTTVLHNKANNQEQSSDAQDQIQNVNNNDLGQENPIWGTTVN